MSESSLSLSAAVAVPVLQWEKFADLVGLERGVVAGLIAKGHIPCLKYGKHRMVNVALLQQRALGSFK